MSDTLRQLGPIDIYLFDQMQRGRIQKGMRLLDAGCNHGRNVHYFLANGFDVSGVDESVDAIELIRQRAAECAPSLPAEQFRCEPIEAMGFEDASFDVVIGIAVLHFASDEKHFMAMAQSLWRVLKPGGTLFCRLASNIGTEDQVQHLEGRRHRLPDGSVRFLVDEVFLSQLETEWSAQRLDPLKTTVVDRQRSMSTWVLTKG